MQEQSSFTRTVSLLRRQTFWFAYIKILCEIKISCARTTITYADIRLGFVRSFSHSLSDRRRLTKQNDLTSHIASAFVT